MSEPVTVEMIRALLAKITPEPWQIGPDVINLPYSYSNFIHAHNQAVARVLRSDDVDLIAAAPAIARYALELSEQVKRLTEVVNTPPNERVVCDCHTWPTIAEMHDYVVALEERIKWTTDERPDDLDNPCAVCSKRMPLNPATAIFGCHYECRGTSPVD